MKREILLIDDDSVLNFIHKKIISLKFPNIPLVVFTNGKQAMEYISNNPKNGYLIFLDINMPVMNGWEFLEALSSKTDINAQIHILTSSIDKIDMITAEKNNAVISYLIKPLTKDALVNLNAKKFSA